MCIRDRDTADKSIIESTLARAQAFEGKPFAIEVLPLENYYSAEEYHQDYLDKNPNGYCHIPVSYTHLDVYKRQGLALH